MIIDEAHKIKNGGATQTKKTLTLSKNIKYKYILTGTPILNSIIDVYWPIYLLYGEDILGKKYSFINKYFITKIHKKNNFNFTVYYPKKNTYIEIKNIINKIGSITKKEECLDLPPIINQDRYFNLNDQKFYEDVYKNKTVLDISQHTLFGKLQKLIQITSGFCRKEDEFIEFYNNRLNTLKEIINELNSNNIYKFIIWCIYKKDYEYIKSLLDDMKIKNVFATGMQTNDERQSNINTFNNENKIALIGNPASSGIGINLTSSQAMIFYNRNFSLEQFLQAQARCHRIGSEKYNKILQFNIICQNTIDEQIVKSLKRKEQVSNKVLSEYINFNLTNKESFYGIN